MYRSETIPPSESAPTPSGLFGLGTPALRAVPGGFDDADEPGEDATPVVDRERFDAISAGDPDEAIELAALFVENLASRAAELAGLDAGDQASLARVAHAIRGIALNFGSRRLSRAAHVLELFARANGARRDDVQRVIDEVDLVCEALGDGLAPVG